MNPTQSLPQPSLSQQIVVIDDHEMILDGVVNLLKTKYPDAAVRVAQTRQAGQELIDSLTPSLVVMDLAIPERTGSKPLAESGVGLIEALLRQYPTLNIAVLSANTNPLVRLKPQIDNHEGGFTVSDKGWVAESILQKVNMALARLYPSRLRSTRG
ncbi:MAG: response regulator [Pegethrix bostrychoides GSE-TBD4-15B]|jgi:CheY-like chemotaxis protein|uniref:Response regulator n=1 Tax=Pegethrix bostrychoides GSE-TBD4-15B TaxID=2839662 RepID=A0A951U4Q6_9CYAN|nr:response regulator [Pegethrix bostrychoides GSE-TBD4-15B]